MSKAWISGNPADIPGLGYTPILAGIGSSNQRDQMSLENGWNDYCYNKVWKTNNRVYDPTHKRVIMNPEHTLYFEYDIHVTVINVCMTWKHKKKHFSKAVI